MIEIAVKDLKIGMYVAQLDRPWLETPYLLQGFRIDNAQQIQQLQRLCKTVKIDEEQSAPTLSFQTVTPSTTHPNLKVTAQPTTTNLKQRFEEDMTAARDVYNSTTASLNKVLHNFRLKDYITIPEVKTCVNGVVSSVMHNPNAMVLLTNLRSKQQDSVTRCINVCIFATLFGRYLAFTQEQLELLGMAALLHDVGEANVPKAILDKYGYYLNAEESVQMQKHTEYGAAMLRKIADMPTDVAEVAHAHHEKIDGTGYPRGLTGDQLNLMTRIISIVDVYEQHTNHPNHARQLSCADALKTLYSLRGTALDADLVERFIHCLGIYPVGSVVQLSNHAIAVVIAVKPNKHLLPTVMLVCNSAKEILHPPQIINLDKFTNHDGKPLLMITKALDSHALDIDLSEYIIKELGGKMDHRAVV